MYKDILLYTSLHQISTPGLPLVAHSFLHAPQILNSNTETLHRTDLHENPTKNIKEVFKPRATAEK